MSLLLITSSPDLHAEVARLAAASDVEVTASAVSHEALGTWASGSLVLVGADAAADLVDLAPPRRAGVHLVGHAPGEAVFRAAVTLGVESVVDLPSGADWLAQLLADLGEPGVVGRAVGVIGGGGGVGASTLACALAQGAARDGCTLLLDADPLGPGLDRMLGLEETSGIRWPDLHGTAGRLGARSLRDSVPRDLGPGVLTWSAGQRHLDAMTAREAMTAARRGHDLVVVDLPRHADDVTLDLAGRCDVVLVLCRADVMGLAGAGRVVETFRLDTAVAGLVMRPGPVVDEDAEAVTGLPVLARLGDQRRVGDALDVGLGPLVGRRGPLARTVAQLLESVA